MYSNKIALAIKSNGKVLRETKDLVHLPYGSEFSVLVKNLDNKRLKFKLEIDGTDVLDGTEIIVNANSETEIKRFIRNGNMDSGNAFKFIERTAAIENGPRGVKIEDGVVRVEAWFENKPTYTPYVEPWPGYRDRIYPSRNDWLLGTTYNSTGGGIQGSMLSGQVRSMAANAIAKSVDAAPTLSDAYAESLNDVGITVPGSKVEQKFTTVYGFIAESQSHVLILKLVGKTADKVVEQAITVKHKPECITCGRKNKATSKFCTACGTALELL